MTVFAKPSKPTEEKYLTLERDSETKYEFYRDSIVAMSGAQPEHNRINLNLASEINQKLKKSPCQAFVSDQRVKSIRPRQYTYPDIVVVCGKPEYERIFGLDTLLNPTVILEVLSESTESADRGIKFINYQSMSTLSDYLLISQDTPLIEHFSRREDGFWNYRAVSGLESTLLLDVIDCEISLADIYDRVIFPDQEEYQSSNHEQQGE